MNHLGFHLLVLYLIFFRFSCEAQVSNSAPSQDAVSNFRPSLAVVIGILSFMFVLTFSLLMYAKCCTRGASSVHGNPESQPWLIRTRSTRFSGIDKTVIESLPFFRFSSLKGSKEGLECAVCLSKFEDVEILRLLPKCKHAFHINCIDNWLENHSSCPLCRHRVDPEDQTIFTYSNSLRLLINGGPAELGEESNVGLFVQREEEEEQNGSSSRINFGSSFRRILKGSSKEEELPIQKPAHDDDDHRKVYHKLKHRITVSDFVLKNRWSNVSSSDLMFLNSEMIGSTSSVRFNSSESQGESGNEQPMNLKEEMERKVSFENKVRNGLKNNNNLNSGSDSAGKLSATSKYMNPDEKRSVSDITAVSRFEALGMKNGTLNKGSYSSLVDQNNVKEERVRQIWLPIAKRTVQWFVNREKRFQQSLNV
ncbi:E3 ubiquitin-protein ligase ATL42 [Neltuma alba]|uniref:E3 ubiquitin-protein ligase ATL42 n=1 Tax=Neltuma alba TaxID=207710 RepID=UPI0010A503DA|nr:E3 ubiquitin-protein ligase ATL42 [Prosopis alba]